MSQQATVAKNYVKLGETLHARMEKVNSDLLSLTYGSLVTQLLKDFADVQTVNEHLEKMGVNIGSRLVEEFLARSGMGACNDFKESMEVLAKVAFKMFLGVTADMSDWNIEGTACTLILTDNPLVDFVELPPTLVNSLHYSNLLCGAITGALEQLYMRVCCTFLKDTLKGHRSTEIRVELKELLREEFLDEEDDDNSAAK